MQSEWDFGSSVWSVTSFSELSREARELARWNRLHPDEERRISHLERCLAEPVPAIAASDYVVAYPQLIASYVRNRFVALGTDGFGRSDARAALRRFFEVDRHHIVLAALAALADEGSIARSTLKQAIERYGLNTEADIPWHS